MSGWIKIDRGIYNHWIFKDAEKFKAWITILGKVNYEPSKVLIGDMLLECGRGESLMSLESWAQLFGAGWNKSKVRRFFKLLEKDNMIVTKSESKTTRLTVCKYDYYQGKRNDDETEVKHKQNGSETQVTPIKEREEYKEIKEEKKRELFLTWLDYRKSIKKGITNQQTLDRLIEKFNLHTFEQIQTVIDYSIDNGYQGLFWDKQTAQQSDNGLKRNSKGELYNPKTHLPDGRLKAAL